MRTLAIFTVTALMLGQVSDTEAAKGKKTKKSVAGTISMVKQDSAKESGTITIKVQAKKKKAATIAPPSTEKTFTISSTTKIESVMGKKKTATTTPAKFSDLATGKLVTLLVDGETVSNVQIATAKKKKKKA
jgi:hypothetical protein